MKPSDFILNSDYLSIAQVETKNYTVYLGGGTLQGEGGYTDQNFDFTTTSQQGAIGRILINKDGGNYQLCAYMQLDPSANIHGFISVYRTSTKNLRAHLVLENYSASSATYPSMTFNIKVSNFRPPNVF